MRRFRPGVSAFLLIVAGMSVAWSARAHTFVVARPDASDAMLNEAFNRLCGELHMYGLTVEIVDGASGAWSAEHELADSASAEILGGVALLHSPGEASAKIWLTRAATGKESVHITVSIAEADAPTWLAIQAADLLRTSLRDLDHAPSGPPNGGSSLPSNGQRSATTSDGFQPWTLSGGAGALWEAGKLGTGFAAKLGLARRVASHVALEISIVAPVTGQAYASTEATARIRQELGTIAVAWRLWGRRRLMVDLVQGLGAMHVSVHGEQVQSPWLPQSESTWAAASSTGGCLGIGLTRHASLNLSAAAVVVLPRPVLQLAEVSYGVRQPLLLVAGEFRYGL